MADVLAQQIAGSGDIALSAQLEDLMMLFIGSLHAMRQVQLQTGITFSAVVHVSDNGHEVEAGSRESKGWSGIAN